MSKKLITALLALAMASTALASCGAGEADTTEADTTVADTTVAEDTTASDEAPEGPVAEITLSDIRDAVAAAFGEEYICNMPVPDAETLEMMFGITSDLYDEFLADTPMIMTHIDTFLAFKPAEGKTADLVAALETYHEGQQMMQYPQNVAKAAAAQVYEKGGYVFYVRLGALPEYGEPEGLTGNETEAELEAIWAQIEADRLELAKANTKKAIDAIDAILG